MENQIDKILGDKPPKQLSPAEHELLHGSQQVKDQQNQFDTAVEKGKEANRDKYPSTEGIVFKFIGLGTGLTALIKGL